MATHSVNPLLEVDHLRVSFRGAKNAPALTVVRDSTFSVGKGEFVALVGESGCGKSVTALSITRLPPTHSALLEGAVSFEGRDITAIPEPDLRRLRSRSISYVFQDPAAALNPVLRIGAQLREAFPRGAGIDNSRAACAELLRLARLPDPAALLKAYPHELSGGMQQRVLIAMAIAGRPKLLIADEPTTALDVTTQQKVLELLDNLRRELDMAVLLITHNLGIVARYAQRLYVMYAGEIVESGPTRILLVSPAHPYTAGLLAAIPRLDTDSLADLRGIPGRVPHPGEWGSGCLFAPRCPRATDTCRRNPKATAFPGERLARCHHPLN